MKTELTEQQIRNLLAGAGPSLTLYQVETLEGALRENKPVIVEELGLLAIPAACEE
jgi:hypothetical protein